MSDTDEWTNSKAQRKALRQKFGGLCGYCGEPLMRMQADHIKPVIRLTTDPWGKPLPASERRCIKPERNVVGNMMPACSSCNSSKGGHDLEGWRDLIARSAEIVGKQKPIFRAGVRFGVIDVTGNPVVFHFEKSILVSSRMDDLIWVNPEPNPADHHDVGLLPRAGYVLYARVDVLAEAEREQGKPRRITKER